MKKFIIEEDFWNIFPDAKIGVLVCTGIDNHEKEGVDYQAILDEAQKSSAKYLKNEQFSENDVIKVWRAAFQKFKTKKGARSSIEALLKRAGGDNPIGSINPLVDIYNCISLEFALPCGAEDLDAVEGDIRLTMAEGDEPFVLLGSEENTSPYPGEIVYKDEAGAICRGFNWREAKRTMITNETTNAFMVMESVDPKREDDLMAALDKLKAETEKYTGAICKIHILDNDLREITFMDEEVEPRH